MSKKDRSPKTKSTRRRMFERWIEILIVALVVIAALMFINNTWINPLEAPAETISSTAIAETTTTTLGGGGTTTTTTSPSTTTTVPPTTTTTVEAEPVSCVILPENLCSQGVLVEWTSDWAGSEGGRVTLTLPAIAFTVPPGTPLSAPEDGEALYVAASLPSNIGFQGREVGFAAFFVRDLESPEIGNFWEPVEEGDVLGLVSQFSATGGKGEVVPSGEYNLIVIPTAGTEMQKELRNQPIDRGDFDAQRNLDRWFWEGWFGIESQPFFIEP